MNGSPRRARAIVFATVLPVLVLASACATRPRIDPDVRTITSIGGSPEAIVAGVPGFSRSAGPILEDRPTRVQERISGRVIDERGRPMANVRVRVADGSASVGRDIHVVTDNAGGFTLNGVRPGREYTLIAERELGDREYYGRVADVVAPDRSVVIAVHDRSLDASSRRVGRVSSIDEFEDDDAAEPEPEPPVRDGGAPRRVNEDDLPPASEAEAIDEPHSVPMAPHQGNGWQSVSPQGLDNARPADPFEPSDAPRRSTQADIETVNPLPPALSGPPDRPRAEPGALETSDPPRSHSSGDEPFTSGTGPLMNEFEPSQASSDRAGARPSAPAADQAPSLPANPSDFPVLEPRKGGQSSEPNEPPVPGDQPSELDFPLPNGPVPDIESPAEPGRAGGNSGAVASRPIEAPHAGRAQLPGDDRSDEFPRPTWSDLVAGMEAETQQAAPEPEHASTPIAAAVNDSNSRSVRRQQQGPSRHSESRSNPSGATDLAQPARRTPAARTDDRVVAATCRYDTRRKQVIDFELPDLNGQPVKFSDLDADYVLLDFWGSWCGPCLKAIPELVELQKGHDPSRLRVIGIAYETSANRHERLQAAESAARSLGVNYTMLMAEADGQPCPLAAAVAVKVYPTMVLLDRHGRIVWRDSGASPQTLDRLVRVVDASLGRTTDRVRR